MRRNIAELRRKELYRLVGLKKEPTTAADDLAEAKRIMNSFYRLCGLRERNLYLSNNERTCNWESTLESEKRESNWYDRLKKQFKNIYGLDLYYNTYPCIGYRKTGGGVTVEIEKYFYE